MIGLEALQNVQYVTVQGKRFAVIDAADWEALIEWLETFEDVEAAKQAYARLKDAGGDRAAAGWIDWNDIKYKSD